MCHYEDVELLLLLVNGWSCFMCRYVKINGELVPEEPKTPPVVIASPDDVYDG